MTTKHKKIRVFTEAELIRRIDRLTLLKRERLVRADKLDRRADVIYHDLNLQTDEGDVITEEERQQLVQKATAFREKAFKLRSMHSTDKRIRHFGEKLAELRTGVLAGLLPDASVQL